MSVIHDDYFSQVGIGCKSVITLLFICVKWNHAWNLYFDSYLQQALSVFEISVTNLLGILFINLVENIKTDTAIKKAIFVTIEKFYTCTDQKIKLLHCKRKKYVFWWHLGVFMQRKNCSWNLYLKMSTHILLVRYLVFCQKVFA